LLLHIAHLSTTTTYHALVLFKQKEKLTKGSASKSDKYEVDTEPTYNLPFQNGKAQKEEESAKGSASKSSKESASLTTEVVPGRLFVSFILFKYIYTHCSFHISPYPNQFSNPDNLSGYASFYAQTIGILYPDKLSG